LSSGKAVPAVSAGTALVVLPMLYFINPNTTKVPLCPLHAVIGLWCPLCGATRATHALLHGDVLTAVHDNALYVMGLPLLLLVWWRWCQLLSSRGTEQSTRLLPRMLTIGIVVAALVFGVVRNLSFGAWLAPPG
jgi:hypothetical protein